MLNSLPRFRNSSVAIVSVLAATFLLVACADEEHPEPDQDAPDRPRYTQYVDPFIGTANEGNTFPGATTPWGMVSVSPHTTPTTLLDLILGRPLPGSGYLHGEPYIYGFGFTHLSGTGCPDLGAPVIAATVGKVMYWRV